MDLSGTLVGFKKLGKDNGSTTHATQKNTEWIDPSNMAFFFFSKTNAVKPRYDEVCQISNLLHYIRILLHCNSSSMQISTVADRFFLHGRGHKIFWITVLGNRKKLILNEKNNFVEFESRRRKIQFHAVSTISLHRQYKVMPAMLSHPSHSHSWQCRPQWDDATKKSIDSASSASCFSASPKLKITQSPVLSTQEDSARCYATSASPVFAHTADYF